MYGNVSELGDAGGKPGKRYLFFLTAYYPGIRLTGDRVKQLGKHLISEVSGAFRRTLKIRGKDLFAPLVVIITTSGLQGEKPLVHRVM